jgi:hypothetical protein
MELHTIAWLDKRRIFDTQAMLDEVWDRAVGADSGNRPAAWQANSAAERSYTAVGGAAVTSR